MASKREQVAAAILQLVTAASPNSDVKRNADRPERIAPGGTMILRDGAPGKPTIDLGLGSPIYNYDHAFELEVATFEAPTMTREQALDALLSPIGEAVAADRTLGGLCIFLDVEAPETDDIEAFGAETARWALVRIVASYATTNPLT